MKEGTNCYNRQLSGNLSETRITFLRITLEFLKLTCNSLMCNLVKLAPTWPTSIHIVLLMSLMAMIYPNNGAPPSLSGAPHSIMRLLGPVGRTSSGAVGGDGGTKEGKNVSGIRHQLTLHNILNKAGLVCVYFRLVLLQILFCGLTYLHGS